LAAVLDDPVVQAIATRQSVYDFTDEPVAESDLRLALDMAVRAPNHRLTRPWRFAVFMGEGRDRLADAFATTAAARGIPAERARGKYLISPVVICVGVSPQLGRPKVVVAEEEHAVAAAVENMLLTLHARGIGSLWATGALCNAPEILNFLGWNEPQDRVIGIVHAGYAAPSTRGMSSKVDHAAYTSWHR
jgi:nitroreductase